MITVNTFKTCNNNEYQNTIFIDAKVFNDKDNIILISRTARNSSTEEFRSFIYSTNCDSLSFRRSLRIVRPASRVNSRRNRFVELEIEG